MRQLFVNGVKADLNESTAIGITFQSGDISEPCKNKLTTTNTFQLPFTSTNKRIFGFSDSPFSSSDIPFNKIVVDYYDGNIHLIKKSFAFLSQTNENYNLSVVAGGGIIDAMKYNQIRSWLNFDILPEISDTDLVIAGNFEQSEDEVYRALMGDIQPPVLYDHFKPITAKIESTNWFTNGIGVKISSIFDFIKTYGIRSYATTEFYDIQFNGTTAQNTEFEDLVIPYHDIGVQEFPQGSNAWCLKLTDVTFTSPAYALSWMGEKTIFDLVKSVCNIYNAVLDISDENKTVKITTFNKILESTNVIDWSNKVISNIGKNTKPKKFTVGTWLQNNYINYKYDDGVNSNGGKVTVICNNKNIEVVKNYDNGLFVPRSYEIGTSGDYFYLLGTSDISSNPLFTQKGIEELVIFYMNGRTHDFYPTVSIYQVYPLNFSDNYLSMRQILTNPCTYDMVLNINILDMYNFSNENLVKLEQLGGVFYVNKITGFNSKAKTGTNVELIKVK